MAVAASSVRTEGHFAAAAALAAAAVLAAAAAAFAAAAFAVLAFASLLPLISATCNKEDGETGPRMGCSDQAMIEAWASNAA